MMNYMQAKPLEDPSPIRQADILNDVASDVSGVANILHDLARVPDGPDVETDQLQVLSQVLTFASDAIRGVLEGMEGHRLSIITDKHRQFRRTQRSKKD